MVGSAALPRKSATHLSQNKGLAPRWATWNHAAVNEDFEFEAVIQAGDAGGAFVFFPFDMRESFGTAGKVPVTATVDGVPYSGKLMKYGFPQHALGLLKSLRSHIGKGPGDTVKITLRRAD
jgi:hypothetical protein